MTSEHLRGRTETESFLLNWHIIMSTKKVLGYNNQQKIAINWGYAITAAIFVEFILSELALSPL